MERHPKKPGDMPGDWDAISGWKVGPLEELAKIPVEKGAIVDKKTRTILFSNDIQNLRDGKDVITEDWWFMAEAGYEAYFNKGGVVFGVHARIFD